MKKSLFLSSDMVDAKIRDEFWRDVSSIVYEVTPGREEGGGFHGTVSSRPFGNMTMGVTTFNDQKCGRSRQLIARSELELCIVQMVLSGQAQGNYNGVDASLNPGDVLIHDLTQLMSAQVTAGARLSIVVARADLQRLVSRQVLHGIVLPAQAPTTRLLTHFMRGLYSVLADLPDDALGAAEEAFLTLLANAINGHEAELCDNLPVNLPMRQRIIAFIDRNLTDPRLGVEAVMNEFRLSRSHLYRTFEQDGGIASFIRGRRLDMAYRLLGDRNSRGLSNKEIMARCGLPDNTHFARLFRERFGVRPTEARGAPMIGAPSRKQATDFHVYLHDYVVKISP